MNIAQQQMKILKKVKKTKSSNKINKTNLDYKKKYLNEQDDFNKNQIISTKILDKNIITKNNIIN